MSKSIDAKGLVYQTKDNGVGYGLQKYFVELANKRMLLVAKYVTLLPESGRIKICADELQNKKDELQKKFRLMGPR